MDEAGEYFLQVLDARRRVLGGLHPSTLVSINNYGAYRYACGDFAQAESCFQEGFDSRRKVLGPRHPSTLSSAFNLATLYCRLAGPTLIATLAATLAADHAATLVMPPPLLLIMPPAKHASSSPHAASWRARGASSPTPPGRSRRSKRSQGRRKPRPRPRQLRLARATGRVRRARPPRRQRLEGCPSTSRRPSGRCERPRLCSASATRRVRPNWGRATLRLSER